MKIPFSGTRISIGGRGILGSSLKCLLLAAKTFTNPEPSSKNTGMVHTNSQVIRSPRWEFMPWVPLEKEYEERLPNQNGGSNEEKMAF